MEPNNDPHATAELVNKRHELTVNIRRSKRDAIIATRRNQFKNSQPSHSAMSQEQQQYQPLPSIPETQKQESIAAIQKLVALTESNIQIDYTASHPQFAAAIAAFTKATYQINQLPNLIRMACSRDVTEVHHGMIGIRKLLSVANSSNIIALILNYQCLPMLLLYARQEEFPRLQMEATWCLANIATGDPEQCKALTSHEVIPLFIKLLRSYIPAVAEQAVWGVGNLSADSVEHRDQLIFEGAVKGLIYLINNAESTYVIKHASWALSNLCRGQPTPKMDLISDAAPILTRLVIEPEFLDEETLIDCLWALTFLTTNELNKAKVIQKGLIKRILELINANQTVSNPAMVVLLNLASSERKIVLELIKQGTIQALKNKLNVPKNISKNFIKLACETLANIAIQTTHEENKMIQDNSLVVRLLQLATSEDPPTLEHICWWISNMCRQDSEETIEFITNYHIIKFLCHFLADEEETILAEPCLTAIENILRIEASSSDIDTRGSLEAKENDSNEGTNPHYFRILIQQNGGTASIQKLQHSKNQTVAQKAMSISQLYLSGDLMIE